MENYNPEKIRQEVEKKELGELGETLDAMDNTTLVEFLIDTCVCESLAKWILKKRHIDINTGTSGND